MSAQMTLYNDGSILAELRARVTFLRQICEAQESNEKLQAKKVQCETSSEPDFQIDSDGCLRFRGRICVKVEHQVPFGLLQPIMVPEWKWDRITMDFVTELPVTPRKKDAIWVIVDRLTKSAHFIPVCTNYSLDELANFYISKIVRLHGAPLSIILDRDLRSMSRFWKKLQADLGTKLNFSTAFHP
ncbi:hypothetical protein ES319_A11G232600v1 [Gossypium barbadense]|uniref:Integrase catalytic domain-containing protein n=1 Tax=Gossypium barbadense TaxID=3634 RepID=A0A5J5TSD5_GOSBA|nr:hypothetical protein ES319_A11G232600v1 [Gossypium barbadense]